MTVIIFLDEVNTARLGPRFGHISILMQACWDSRSGQHDSQHKPLSLRSCLGFVKAILCDKFLVSDYENLFIIAASNPYREEASGEDLVLRGSATVMRDFFQAQLSSELSRAA